MSKIACTIDCSFGDAFIDVIWYSSNTVFLVFFPK